MKATTNYSGTNSSLLKAYPLEQRSKEELLSETLIACLLFVLGVTGNSLVCYVIYKKRFTSSSMYFFMLNLACADLLVCFASIPLTLLATRPEPVKVAFGAVGCKVIRFIQYMLPPASVAILTATAIDRYFHICIPLRRIITTRATKQLAGICWGCAIFLTMPVLFLIETVDVTYKGEVYQFCNIQETSTYPKAGMIYLMFRGALGFAIPLAVISILYFKIVQTVWKRDSQHSTNKQRTNVVKSLLTVVVAFSLSWTPFSVCNKYYLYYKQDVITTQEIITFWVGLSASVYNPVIYAFFNKKFRNAFVAVILGRSKTQSSQAVVIGVPTHRPRSQTLPALLETQQDIMILKANNDSNTRTRHLSLAHHQNIIFTSQKSGLHSNEFSDGDTTRMENKQQENMEIKVLEKRRRVERLPPISESSGTQPMDCAGANQNGVLNVSKIRRFRKIGLPNFLPNLSNPKRSLQRSQTFQDRNYVTSSGSLVNHDIRHNDVNRLYFSRYAGDRTKISKSKSFNGTRTVNCYENHVPRI